MKLYKLTKLDMTTYGGCKWGEGVTHETSGKGGLCGPGWLHAYISPELAILLNPIYANYDPCLLWECEGSIGKSDFDLKVGCTRLTTVKQISLPQISIEQKIKFGILCAKAVYKNSNFNQWADDWLNNKDRSKAAANAAAATRRNSVANSIFYVTYAATFAAYAATYAANAATYAANAATYAANAATYAANAANAATYAANAANVATYATYADTSFDLQDLALRALS